MTTLETKLERRGNVCTISTEKGVYSVVYNPHIFRAKREHVPKTDGLFLEWVCKKWSPERSLNHVEQNYVYRDIIKKAESDGTPLFLPDIGVWSKSRVKLETFLESLEYGAGITAGAITPAVIQYNLALGALSGLFSGWVLSHCLAQLIGLVSDLTGIGQSITLPLVKYADTLHPEFGTFKLKIRNKLIAYKQQRLQESTGDAHYTTIIGPGHVLIEDDLQSSLEEKLTYLQKYAPLLKRTCIPESIYLLPKGEYKDNKWHLTAVYEFPELKELITK